MMGAYTSPYPSYNPSPYSISTVRNALETYGGRGYIRDLAYDEYRMVYEVMYNTGEIRRHTLQEVQRYVDMLNQMTMYAGSSALGVDIGHYTGTTYTNIGAAQVLTYKAVNDAMVTLSKDGTVKRDGQTLGKAVESKKEKQDRNIKRLAAYRKRKGVVVH